MAIYVDSNKKVKKIFVSVNGEKKNIVSAWVNRDGMPAKVFQYNSSEIDPYDIACNDEHMSWGYTLDNDNNVITLNKYTGTEDNVIVYANYIIDDVIYKAKLNNGYGNNYFSSYLKHIFSNCTNIKSIRFSKNFDTSNLTIMNQMFYNCKSLSELDIRCFDTSNVTEMCYMFGNCQSLTTINVNNFDTSNVTRMREMFVGCSLLSVLDLSSFDTNNVTDMFWMFYDCSRLKTIYVSSKWITSQVTNKDTMFDKYVIPSVIYI